MFLSILPFLILVFLFSYFPLYGWVYSLYDYKPALGLSGSEFVGLQWFRLLIGSPTQLAQIGQVMANTLGMSFIGIASSVLPLAFAVFLNEIRAPWFRNAIQTLTTLPNFISWVLVYMIAFSMFSTTGLVNTLMLDSGLITVPTKFLDSDQNVWLTMAAWGIWKTVGWGAIMYLAAIAGIDQALYESAKVDGAGRFQRGVDLVGCDVRVSESPASVASTSASRAGRVTEDSADGADAGRAGTAGAELAGSGGVEAIRSKPFDA
ncbi:sugar ABC transporter permease [Tessaracoccus sp. MC1627]|nr:sugar ABC transporter permease [Tessaracoccus sp. MC1627]